MNCRLGGNGGDLTVEEVWLALDKLQHIPSPNDLFNLEFRIKRGLDELDVGVNHLNPVQLESEPLERGRTCSTSQLLG